MPATWRAQDFHRRTTLAKVQVNHVSANCWSMQTIFCMMVDYTGWGSWRSGSTDVLIKNWWLMWGNGKELQGTVHFFYCLSDWTVSLCFSLSLITQHTHTRVRTRTLLASGHTLTNPADHCRATNKTRLILAFVSSACRCFSSSEMFFSIRPPHFMTVMSWMAMFVRPQPLNGRSWAAGFEGNVKLVVTCHCLPCYYIISDHQWV